MVNVAVLSHSWYPAPFAGSLMSHCCHLRPRPFAALFCFPFSILCQNEDERANCVPLACQPQPGCDEHRTPQFSPLARVTAVASVCPPFVTTFRKCNSYCVELDYCPSPRRVVPLCAWENAIIASPYLGGRNVGKRSHTRVICRRCLLPVPDRQIVRVCQGHSRALGTEIVPLGLLNWLRSLYSETAATV